MVFLKQLVVLSVIFLGSNQDAMERTFHREAFQNAYAYEKKLNNTASWDRAIDVPREAINTKYQQQHNLAQHDNVAQQQNNCNGVALHGHTAQINKKEQINGSFYRPHVDSLKQIKSHLQSSVYRDNLIEKKALLEKGYNRTGDSKLQKQNIFIDALLDSSIYRMLTKIQKADLRIAINTFAELEQSWPWVNQSSITLEEKRFIKFLGVDIMQVAHSSLICRKDYLNAHGILSHVKDFQCCARNMQLDGNIQGLKDQRSQILLNYKKNYLRHTPETKAKLTIINLILSNPLTQILDTIKNAEPDIAIEELSHFKMQLLWHFETKNLKNMDEARADMLNREGVDLLEIANKCFESRNNVHYCRDDYGRTASGTFTSSATIIGVGIGNQGGGDNSDYRKKPDPNPPFNGNDQSSKKKNANNAISSEFKDMQLRGEIKELEAKMEELKKELRCLNFWQIWQKNCIHAQIDEIKALLTEELTELILTIQYSDLDTARFELERCIGNPPLYEIAEKVFNNRPENRSPVFPSYPPVSLEKKDIINNSTITNDQDIILNNEQDITHINSLDMVSTTINQDAITLTSEAKQCITETLDTLNDQSLEAVSSHIDTLVAILKEQKLDAQTHGKCFADGLKAYALLQKYAENPTKQIVAQQDKNILVFNARKNALESVAHNPTECYAQSYELTPQAYAALQSCDIDPEQFTYCFGNEAQQQLNYEFVDILNKMVETESNISTQPLFDLVITCTHVGNAYAQQNNLDKAFSLADCAWAALDCAKMVCDSGIDIAKKRIPEAAEGMFEGCINAIYNTAHMITHPRETIRNLRQSFSHLGECLVKFALSVPDPENQFISPEIDEIKAELRQEIMGNIIDVASQMTFKGTVSFATEQLVSGKLFCLGMSCIKHYADPSLAQLGKIVKGFKDKAVDKAPKFASAIHKKVTDQLGNFTKAEHVVITGNGAKVPVSGHGIHLAEEFVEHGTSNNLASKMEIQPSSQAVKKAAIIAEEQVVIKSTQSLAELRQSVLSLEKRMLTKDELKMLRFQGDSCHKIDSVNPKTGHIRVFTEIQGDMEKAQEVLNTVKKEFEIRKLIRPEETIEKNGVKMTFCDFEDGSRVQIRTEGKSGHIKVDINDVLANTYEKITFK